MILDHLLGLSFEEGFRVEQEHQRLYLYFDASKELWYLLGGGHGRPPHTGVCDHYGQQLCIDGAAFVIADGEGPFISLASRQTCDAQIVKGLVKFVSSARTA